VNPSSIRMALALLASGLASIALASPAAAVTLGPYPGSAPITIPASGQGSIYPASFSLGSAGGEISSMTAHVNVSHNFAGDIDMMLVSPQGTGVMLMSDSCGAQAISNLDLTFSDAAASQLPTSSACTSGTYKPTDVVSTPEDSFPAPAPSTWSSALSAFNGTDPTGDWKLFVFDDASGDAGTVNSWSLTFEVTKAEISIPEFDTSGKAGPYPSTKTFDTPPGQVIESFDLNIDGFGHESPEDVDMLLADSHGNSAVIMSDACGGDPEYGLDFTFADTSPFILESGPGCISGGVLTTDFETAPPDQWPAPAPTPQFGNFSDIFAGTKGGPFSLYVVDDSAGGFGYINSWNIAMTTRPATGVYISNRKLTVPEGKSSALEIRRDGPSPYGVAEVTLSPRSGTAKAGKDIRGGEADLKFARNSLGADISVRPIDDGIAEKAETFKMVLSDPKGDAALSNLTDTAVITIPASKNATLKLGKLKLKGRKGTLAARISAPGTVTVSGKGLKKAKKKLKQAGELALPIRVTGKGRVKAKVVYRTLGGRKVTRSRQIR